MSNPFLGEIRMVSFSPTVVTPRGWAQANGQTLPISQNQALFSLLGTTYGGDGQTTFQLPNLRGRVPISMGLGFTLGQAGGAEAVTISQQTMPQHSHQLQGTLNSSGNVSTAGNALLAASGNTVYQAPGDLVAMDPSSVTNIGGSQAHENRQPYLVINFLIALQGIFPSQN